MARTSNTILSNSDNSIYILALFLSMGSHRVEHDWSDLTMFLIYRESNQSFINKYNISWGCLTDIPYEVKEVSFCSHCLENFYRESVWILSNALFFFLHQLIWLYDFSSLAYWYSRLQWLIFKYWTGFMFLELILLNISGLFFLYIVELLKFCWECLHQTAWELSICNFVYMLSLSVLCIRVVMTL